MLTKPARSTRRVHTRGRFLYLSLAAAAVLLVVSPGFAAGAQPAQGAPSGESFDTTNTQNRPDATCPSGGQCFADVPSNNPFYAFVNRIFQQDLVSGYPCGGPGEPCDDQSRPYYRPNNNVNRQQMAKFIDNARRLPGIDIEVTGGSVPIIAENNTGTAIGAYSTSGQALSAQSQSSVAIYAQTGNAPAISGLSTDGISGIGVQGEGHEGVKGTGGVIGVEGASTSGDGVYGTSTSGDGVFGGSDTGYGVFGLGGEGVGVAGESNTGTALSGESGSGNGLTARSDTNGDGAVGMSDSGHGVVGISTSGNGVVGSSTNGNAGYFSGNVTITGTCTGCLGSSKIDDPLDPANQYLYHSTVQSPDMMDIYNGNVTTDAKGEAIVTMPAYFEALNRDFRYQLTVIGQFAQAIVSSEIKDNTFNIKTDKPNVKVSWLVTGIRQDPYSNAHRTPVEEAKPADEQGKYLHPTELGQPASSGVDFGKQGVQSKP